MSTTDPQAIIIAKKAAGYAAAELILDGMNVGLGSGSTSAYFIEALAKRCQAGLKISAIAASVSSTRLAQAGGIPLLDPQSITALDLTVDGADEIDHKKNMIKGGGGALLREKLLAQASREMVVIIDETKLVDHLGATFPVPVEITPFAYQTTLNNINNEGYQGTLRLTREDHFYVTDNGNYIYDIHYPSPIQDPEHEHAQLKAITGVIETGLFFHIAGRVVIGYKDGCVKIRA